MHHMATPRSTLVDPEVPLYYHITSRCVRGAWLMGTDHATGENFDHRRDWLVNWMHQIAPAFPIEVQTYAVMSNHFHLVVYYDPKDAERWSDREVAERWFIAHPAQRPVEKEPEAFDLAVDEIVRDSDRLAHCRRQLGSLSEFMKCLKQPIAQRINAEDGKDGHVWSKRFYSGPILSEDALLATMAYVDLNPMRAKITAHIEDANHTGLAEQIRIGEMDHAHLEAYLAPCATGVSQKTEPIRMTLAQYRQWLRELLGLEHESVNYDWKQLQKQKSLTSEERWWMCQQVLKRRPRVIGQLSAVRDWLEQRGLHRRELPLPAPG